MKISKLLPIAFAFALCATPVLADGNTNPKVEYQLDVPTYYNVVTQSPAVTTASVTGDYTGLDFEPMIGTYQVTSNIDSKNIYFYAECLSNSGDVPALGGTPAAPFIVFTNAVLDGTVNNSILDSTSIAAVRAGSQDSTKSANAIVLPLAITYDITEGVGAGAGGAADMALTPAVSGTENDTQNIKYTIPNCRVTFTCTVSDTITNNSLSTLDSSGLYKATLYLADTAQAL